MSFVYSTSVFVFVTVHGGRPQRRRDPRGGSLSRPDTGGASPSRPDTGGASLSRPDTGDVLQVCGGRRERADSDRRSPHARFEVSGDKPDADNVRKERDFFAINDDLLSISHDLTANAKWFHSAIYDITDSHGSWVRITRIEQNRNKHVNSLTESRSTTNHTFCVF